MEQMFMLFYKRIIGLLEHNYITVEAIQKWDCETYVADSHYIGLAIRQRIYRNTKWPIIKFAS